MQNLSLFELEEKLDSGEITSLDLVHYFLERIAKYDQSGLHLNSIGEINPDIEVEAVLADKERKEGKKKSPLHGIPVVLKDNINTHDHMHTSAGSKTLKDLYAPYDATIVKQIRETGMIILGKANLSEFANFISTAMPNGFSSKFGQVISPYHDYIDPTGSSTGSAVAVAAGLIPIAIGTETHGSLTSPAKQNNIVTLKPTVGLVSRYGIIPITSKQDTAGPMSKTVKESALMMNYLCKADDNDIYTSLRPKDEYDFLAACDKSVKGMKIGLLKAKNVNYTELENEKLNEAKRIFEANGATVKEVELENIRIENYTCLIYEFKSDLNIYLNTVKKATQYHTLKDIVENNAKNPSVYCPFNQEILEKAEATSGLLREKEYIEAKLEQERRCAELQQLLDENDLDVLFTTHSIPHAPIGGYPILSVPAKALDDIYPMNMHFFARKFDDELLFTVANLYEENTHYRIEPNLEREIFEVERDSNLWFKKYRK